MILYLPYEDFHLSAKAMDFRTLTLQRFEAWRLLHMLKTRVPYGMEKHPTLLMWEDYPSWLAAYGMAICSEWSSQADRETELTELFRTHIEVTDLTDTYPLWLGDSLLHLSHRSNMIKLNPEHYLKLWPGIVEGLPLAWPAETEDHDG